MFFLLASDDLDGLKPTPENLDEIEEALADLDDDPNMGTFGSGPYWPKIRDRLLRSSSSQDPKEAIKEWKFVRSWTEHGGQCELCDHHPIKYHFQIENRLNSNRMTLGSECIYNYLQIPGVPNKETLKKRLNQIRSMAKAVAEGRAGEGAVQELEQLQDLERNLNILIGKVSSPDRDTNVTELYAELADPYNRLNMLGANTSASKTFAEVYNDTRKLQRFLVDLGKRSKSLTSQHMLPAVAAIMRFRDLGERKAMLKQLQTLISAAFKLGRAEEGVEMAWAEIRSCKKDSVTRFQSIIEDAKSKVQSTYTNDLEQLKPYSHLAFIIQAGINLVKGQMDKDAVATFAALDELVAGGKINREALSPYKFQSTWGYQLNGNRSSVEAEALAVLRWYAWIPGSVRYLARELELLYKIPGGVKDLAGISKALLDSADDGEIDLAGQIGPGLFKNTKFMEHIVKEVDEVAAFLKATQGAKVYEAFGTALNFDVRKFYESIPVVAQHDGHRFLQGFGRDILAKWMAGRLPALSPKQRGVIEKRGKKAEGQTLWDAMQSEFNKRFTPKTASTPSDESVYQYGR